MNPSSATRRTQTTASPSAGSSSTAPAAAAVVSVASRARAARAAVAVVMALVGVALLLAGCAATSSRGQRPPGTAVRVGSANFAENRLLAEMYAQGLADRGVAVERRFSVGTRETYYPALLDGSIDLVPEYTGALLLYLDPRASARRLEDVHDQLTDKLSPALRLLDSSRAQDADTIVVTADFAKQHRPDPNNPAGVLSSLEQLAPLCSTIAFGGPPEFQRRPYGTTGLTDTYNCAFGEVRPLDAGGPQTVTALRTGTVQAADLFSSDPAITDNGFVALADPRANFPDESVVPLIGTDADTDPRIDEVLNRISGALDTTALVNLNRRLAAPDRPDEATVAHDWLIATGIIH